MDELISFCLRSEKKMSDFQDLSEKATKKSQKVNWTKKVSMLLSTKLKAAKGQEMHQDLS